MTQCRQTQILSTPTLPSLRCQVHWQNTQSQSPNQILPKNLPARPTPTHRKKYIAAIMNNNYKNKNGQLVTCVKINCRFEGI